MTRLQHLRPEGHPGSGPDFGFEFTAMGSPCRIRLGRIDEASARALADEAIAEVRRIEAKYSRYRADSVVSRINVLAGTGEALQLDEETAALFRYAERLHEGSEGRFDLTSGVLRRAWDFRHGRIPRPEEVEALLPLVGWTQVIWQDGCLALPRRGMEIDLGGLGKEYAADRAATLLTDAGVLSGYVNLGGDIRVIGPQADGQPWRMGIAHPRVEGAIIAGLDLASGALATSGDYERFVEADGRRFCHILDPHTGWPVGYWRSVSVVAPACLAAGALTTVAMLMQERAVEFLRAQGVGFLAIDPDGEIVQEGV
jgi:FAD:protein FMN transferase